MASIVIDDLEQDHELDAKALKMIAGGSNVSRTGSLLKHYPTKLPMEESKLIPGLLKSPAFKLD